MYHESRCEQVLRARLFCYECDYFFASCVRILNACVYLRAVRQIAGSDIFAFMNACVYVRAVNRIVSSLIKIFGFFRVIIQENFPDTIIIHLEEFP